jgi:hypothetical protein
MPGRGGLDSLLGQFRVPVSASGGRGTVLTGSGSTAEEVRAGGVGGQDADHPVQPASGAQPYQLRLSGL